MDILTVSPTAQIPDLDDKNAIVIWLLGKLNNFQYPTLDEAQKAINAAAWLVNLQTNISTAKAVIVAAQAVPEVIPSVEVPPVEEPVPVEILPEVTP